MRYSLVFKLKNEMKWVYADDFQAILLVCSSLKLCHLPFALYDHRTIVLENYD